MTGAVFACLLPLLAAAADPADAAASEADAVAPPPPAPPPPSLKPKPSRGRAALGAALAAAGAAGRGEDAGAEPMDDDSGLGDEAEAAAAALARGVAAGDAGALERLAQARAALRRQPPAGPALHAVQVRAAVSAVLPPPALSVAKGVQVRVHEIWVQPTRSAVGDGMALGQPNHLTCCCGLLPHVRPAQGPYRPAVRRGAGPMTLLTRQ